ncbi:MAG: type II toxin-antitoxin system VapC family toxin [Clostridiales bacterium]|jgi:tRNA(fMet)-specific endonuclease VapC|nr:type II toxin-antitoxin system VapC family toxin [Clostridiales bacterium]
MVYFLDTNICIYILNNKYPYLIEQLEHCNRSSVKIPAAVYYELCYRAAKSRNSEKAFERLNYFTSEIEIVPFDEQAAEIAGKIRADLEPKGQIIGGNDIVIASTALSNNATLVTNNVREFERVQGLALENWVRAE